MQFEKIATLTCAATLLAMHPVGAGEISDEIKTFPAASTAIPRISSSCAPEAIRIARGAEVVESAAVFCCARTDGEKSPLHVSAPAVSNAVSATILRKDSPLR